MLGFYSSKPEWALNQDFHSRHVTSDFHSQSCVVAIQSQLYTCHSSWAALLAEKHTLVVFISQKKEEKMYLIWFQFFILYMDDFQFQ